MRHPVQYGAIAMLMLLGAGTLAADREEEGRQAYEATCARCHDTGIMDAPVTTNPGDWDGRSDLWEAVLFEHAQLGYIRMPAKGGEKDASDYDVEAAAEYMIKTAKPDHPSD